MKHQLITGAAIAAILSGTVALTTPAESNAAGKEKCYGISKAGQNDCGNLAGTHSCAAQSTVDNDIGEWKLVAKGTCKDLGGYSKAEAQKIYDAQTKGQGS